MSTPVSVEPPPRAHLRTDSEQERDLQVKLQRMINLQYQEQHLSEGDSGFEGAIQAEEDPRGTIGMPKRTTTELMDLNAMGGGNEPSLNAKAITPWPSENLGLPPPSPQQGIGRGTLHFPSTYQGNSRLHQGPEASTNQLLLNPPQQIYSGYGAVPDQHHEFHYGNPDYHDPYDAMHDMKKRQEKPVCDRICCLYRPLVNFLSQEHLHRSFCYGAIDGMLTGSGIVSAFCALNVLTVHTKYEIRLAVVAFSASACIADSLCMAIGHIWTSFVVSSGHAQERARERRLLDSNKSDAKAKLVEMLLERGMLKIDAMSLADTLEGYPDLFVSALVGDSLLAGPEDIDEETDDGTAPVPVGVASFGGFGSWKYPSYGQFNEMDHDPEAGNVSMIVKESQREGFVMMVGFATFAVIPSLLWLLLPLSLEPSTSAETSTGQTISLPSFIVSILALIMWFLGVWKSQFLDSNWAMFGIETVVVLLVCVMSSYGVGLALSYVLGDGLDGIILSNQS